MKFHLRSVLALLLAAGPALSLAGKAHQHGVAQLDVAVEPTRVTLLLEMPLDVLLGFEREPRSDAERAQVDAALAKLRNAATLFRTDPAAQCQPGRVDLLAPVLGLGAATKAAGSDGHADLEASYEFSCKDAQRSGFVEAALFDAFPRLQRIDVQSATRKGQMKATLKRPVTRVPLAR